MPAESEPRPVANAAVQLTLTLHGTSRSHPVSVPIRELMIAGWTGRDPATVEAHIRELEALGVPRPNRTPTFYPMPPALLTTAPAIEVAGRDSTGEVECVLIEHEGEVWVGLGSDHTDRKLETISIARSKEACAKPVAPEAWRLADVEPHWDDLILRSYARSGGATTLYQQGTAATLRRPRELMALYAEHHRRSFGPAIAMFCGTFAVTGGLRWADTFMMELEDPILRRRIAHSYEPREVTAPAGGRGSNEGA